MEKFYKIKENLAEIVLPINVYPLVAVKKALSVEAGGPGVFASLRMT